MEPDHDSDRTAGPRGLTAEEVAERVAVGRVNRLQRAPVRTLGEIVRANVFTWVNAIVGVLFVLVCIAGHPADGLFVGVIVSNSVIGIVQELRARKTLESLAVLNAPRVRLLRDGAEREGELGEIVVDDLLVVTSGDQLAVDGEVVEAAGLEVDESLLTGEADSVDKAVGDEVLSGSFVVAGRGVMRATKVGAESYASSLAEEARRFELAPSGLRGDVDRILRWQMLIIPPIAVLLFVRQLGVHDDWRDAVIDMVAAAAAMVPAGLALLISIAFVVGVIELARRKALAKELASVELLARVDTLCLDKTGTITTGEMSFAGIEDLGAAGDDSWMRSALATLVAAEQDPNPTLQAIASGVTDAESWDVAEAVPFSSARKWAAVRVDGEGSVYLGAPEMVLGDRRDDSGSASSVGDAVGEHAAAGQRVLVVARSEQWAGAELPDDIEPVGLVVLEDTVRPDANEIFEYFVAQHVELKVISGDNPRTVSAVATRAGVPGADQWLDARELPDDEAELADRLATTTVFGRVSPHQKRAMVHALQSQGRVVAMTGDGVNDVLALKDSNAGISMGSGSAATRAVAQLVLLDDRFATLPVALAQGRRVVNNIERVANLFLTKTAYAVTLALLVGIFSTPFPFLPRQQTIVDAFSIGVPGFILALAPAPDPIRPGMLRRVLSFAVPAGVVTGVVSFVLFDAVSSRAGTSLAEARTAATFTLLGVALVVLILASRPLAPWKFALAAGMLGFYAVVTAIGPLRRYFQLDVPDESAVRWQIAVAIAVGAAAVVAVRFAADRFIRTTAAVADAPAAPAAPVAPAAED